VFDAEKVDETLLDITPGLPGPGTDPFRLTCLEPYAEAARMWLHDEAEVVDTTHLTPAEAAQQIAEAVKG
jgi:hypothetical protein